MNSSLPWPAEFTRNTVSIEDRHSRLNFQHHFASLSMFISAWFVIQWRQVSVSFLCEKDAASRFISLFKCGSKCPNTTTEFLAWDFSLKQGLSVFIAGPFTWNPDNGSDVHFVWIHCVMRCLDVHDFNLRWSMNSSWVPHTMCIVLQSFRSWPRSWCNSWTSKANRPLWMERLPQDVLIHFALFCTTTREKYTMWQCDSDRSEHVIQYSVQYVYRTCVQCFLAHIFCTLLDGSCFCELQITGKDAPDSQETATAQAAPELH